MNFATWSIRNPIPAIMLFVLMSIAGLIGFHRLSIQNFPDLDFPAVTINLSLPGAAPAQLETQVARKVEDSLASLIGIKHMRSAITDGQVQINVEFQLTKSLTDALIETKDAVDRVRSDLPVNLQPPIVKAVIAGSEPILTYAMSASHLDEESLSWYLDDTLTKRILAVPGIGRFERAGGVQREVRVVVDPVKLAAFGATAVEVSRALGRVQQESSGGRSQLGEQEQSLRTLATVKQAQELANLPIVLKNGRQLLLSQVAHIEDAIAERSQAALLDGKSVVGFKLYRAKGFDETRVADQVNAILASISQEDPRFQFNPVSSTVDYTREQYRGSMDMLYEGALLAILVVFWFLRDWRATIVAAAALPLSILPAFAIIHWAGFSLNTITLLALAVVVGILVDDAIVEVENIERHSRMGKTPLDAVIDAVNEIALAVIATTLTLVVVFLPTAMMGGIPGLFFREFGWTAVVAVLTSLLVARVITPVMAVYLLKPKPHPEQADSALMHRYMKAVAFCLRHKRSTVVAAIVFFAVSISLVPLLPKGLIPEADRGYTSFNFELPPGSSLAEALKLSEAARRELASVEGVQHVFTHIGGVQTGQKGVKTAGEIRKGSLVLILAPRGKRPDQIAIEKMSTAKLQAIAGARFTQGVAGPGGKLALMLSSDDGVALKARAQLVERELRNLSHLNNISSTASLERPEMIIRPDLNRATELGVTTEDIGETLRVATSGDFDSQTAKLDLENRQIPIQVRIADLSRQHPETLADLYLPARQGAVPLGHIASIQMESGPSQIDRYDRKRYVTISADLGGKPLGEALKAAQAMPSVAALPANVTLMASGDAEIMAELGQGFGIAFAIGVVCVFCVLVLLFKDFLQPVTILVAIPLSLGGAFIALLLMNSMLSIPSMIGLIMLMGIVTKNSILLVEYANQCMQQGLSIQEALLDACHKRVRPIVMTTLAMIAGMLPIALGLGADASFRQPMAIAVIGGLITSTALSLLVVPVAFVYIEKMQRKLTKLFSRETANHY